MVILMITLDEHFGRTLRQARNRAELSQTEVGRRMGRTRAAVSRLEGRDNIEENTVRRYAQALGLRVLLRVVK